MFSTNLRITKTNYEKIQKLANFLLQGINSAPVLQLRAKIFTGNIFFLQWDIYENQKIIVGESCGGGGCTVGHSSPWPIVHFIDMISIRGKNNPIHYIVIGNEINCAWFFSCSIFSSII